MHMSIPQAGVGCSRRQARQLQQLAGAAAERRRPSRPGTRHLLRPMQSAPLSCLEETAEAHTASPAQHHTSMSRSVHSDFTRTPRAYSQGIKADGAADLQLGADAVVLELGVQKIREREDVHWRPQVLRHWHSTV